MPEIFPWRPAQTSAQVLERLWAGECVALPTECTYEVACLANGAERLALFESSGAQPALVLPCDARGRAGPEVFDWLPLLRGAPLRLLANAGAARWTLQANAGCAYGLASRLPEAARRMILREECLAVRWPHHSSWRELAFAPVPIVSVPVAAYTTDAAADLVGDRVAAIVDAGPTPGADLPSVVRVQGGRCRLSRSGSLRQEELDAWTACHIVFVCTGNTCRSPMAAALCKKLLAEHLGCLPQALNQAGFFVQSAGLAAMMGAKASQYAVQAAAELGADLTQHLSRTATMEMLTRADHVFAMTASHWLALEFMPQVRLLCPDDSDIQDPIGAELSEYRTCAGQILDCLRKRLPELLEA